MANLKEVRERMKSVNSTQQITKAMKMVSAAKLNRAQNAITRMRPYSDKLNEMLVNILSNLEGDVDSTFGEEREVENALIVVITSNRGLCGAFNNNVIKATNKLLEGELKGVNTRLVCIGKRGYEFFKKRHDNVNDKYVDLFSDLSFDNVSILSERIMDKFEAGKYDKVVVAYGKFINAVQQDIVVDQFLPVAKIEGTKEGEEENNANADYLFEPSKDELLKHLIPSILKITFHKYLLDTHASEHGARMTAMDNATENAQELLRELKISYNKARQEAITKEISEIVGGAAAMESAS